MTYLAQGVGSFLGVLTSAFLVEHFTCETQFAIGNGVIAIAGVLSAFVNDVYSFSALRFLAYICIGYLETGIYKHICRPT